MPPSKRQQQAMDVYAALMEEAKIRLDAIEALCKGELKQALPPLIAAEAGYLQLRMLCELIALACLVAHGDIKETQSRRLRKEWKPDRIIRALEKLHPAFYPTPMRVSQQAPKISGSKRQIHSFEEINSGFLTKTALSNLYMRLGKCLHRGSITDFASRESALPGFDQIYLWAAQIGNLLNIHSLSLFDKKSAFYCLLRKRGEIGQVQVAFADSLPELPAQ